jgi:site-specific DNA recombinase
MKDTLYIYCRVSTSGQDKNGVSLEVQEGRGLGLSKKLNLTPIVIKEQGSGMKHYIPHIDENGKKQGRPLFTDLIDELEEGKVKNVWIDEDTRLTRLDTDQQYIHILMKKKEVNLFVGTSIEPKKWDWITDLVDTIITKVNQNQIRTQVRKSIRSKRKLFSEGCYMKGQPPFGYDLDKKKLVVHKENSEWVRKMFNSYDKGLSTVYIRTLLFNGDVKPPSCDGGMWGLNTITGILKNENYIGKDVYRDLVGTSPQIIEKEIFNSVQKKLKSRMGKNITFKNDFLLRGVIKCSDGKPMSCLGVKKSRKHPLYSCGHRDRLYKKRDVKTNCEITRSIRSHIMDDYVWNSLVNILSQSHTIREETKKEILGRNSSITKRSMTNKLKSLRKKISELDNNRLELEKRFYTNQIPKVRFDEIQKHINGNEEDILTEIKDNEMKIDLMTKDKEWIDWLGLHFRRMEDIRNEKDFKKKKDIINHYLHEVSVLNYDEDTKQHTLTFKFKFPLFNDKLEWNRYKNGNYRIDTNGRRNYKITEGDKSIDTNLTLQYTPHHGRIV